MTAFIARLCRFSNKKRSASRRVTLATEGTQEPSPLFDAAISNRKEPSPLFASLLFEGSSLLFAKRIDRDGINPFVDCGAFIGWKDGAQAVVYLFDGQVG